MIIVPSDVRTKSKQNQKRDASYTIVDNNQEVRRIGCNQQ